MKKIRLTLLLIGLFVWSACEDQLNQKPISSSTTANFYRDASDFEQAVNGVYNALRGYPSRAFYLSENRSDNIYGYTDGVRDWEPINNFYNTISSNPFLNAAWVDDYLGIFRANTVLENLNAQKVPEASTRAQFEGESRFLRAFFYFDLVRLFGKVPLIDHVVTPIEVLDIKRTAVAEVYDLIISDLEAAISLLPDSYASASDNGRITSHAARGILALVYLTRSGPTYGIEGPGMASNEYSKAITLLNEIISSGKYSSLSNYASIFAYDNENNAEVIFDIQYEKGQLGIGASYPGDFGPQSYFASIGVPFAIGLPICQTSNDLLNAYSTDDVRKDFTHQVGYTTSTGAFEPRAFERKWIEDNGYGGDRFDWPINFIVLRYTDVLMMKAECILQGASGTQQEVDDIVNNVRTRAGEVSTVSNVTLDMLLAERRKEFAGECSRWHDLVRTGKAITTMTAFDAVEDVSDQMSIPTNDMIIYAIPTSQLNVKIGLYEQNPGYN